MESKSKQGIFMSTVFNFKSMRSDKEGNYILIKNPPRKYYNCKYSCTEHWYYSLKSKEKWRPSMISIN
jgi:hypothetical protein